MQAPFNLETIRIAFPQLDHVHTQDSFQVISDRVCADSQVPSDVTQLLCQVLPVQLVSLEEGLLDQVSDFPALTAETECRIFQQAVDLY